MLTYVVKKVLHKLVVAATAALLISLIYKSFK